jgi:hypothetical protein
MTDDGVSGCLGAFVRRILEQKIGDSRSSWLMFLFCRDDDHHSVYAGRLGRFRRRVPGHDREGCFPDEGSRPFRCVCLFTATRRDKGFALKDGGIRLKHHSSAGCQSDESDRRLLVLRFLGWNESLSEK